MIDPGIDAFGSSAVAGRRGAERVREDRSPGKLEEPEDRAGLEQWAVLGDDSFLATSRTKKRLPPGLYTFEETPGGMKFCVREVNVDGILKFSDSMSQRIVAEVATFWSRKDYFEKYGYLHRRGYLLFGPPGSGKSILVQQITAQVIANGNVVFLCNIHPEVLDRALRVFRIVEPSRYVVCVFEDIDAYILRFGEEQVLGLLDGESQVTGVLNLATTNYPERLDKRIVSRPRRFDRLVFIDHPTQEVRYLYLSEKLKVNQEKAKQWSEDTDKFSFAALADLVISVECLEIPYEEALKKLKAVMLEKQSSTRFTEGAVGFRQDAG